MSTIYFQRRKIKILAYPKIFNFFLGSCVFVVFVLFLDFQNSLIFKILTFFAFFALKVEDFSLCATCATAATANGHSFSALLVPFHDPLSAYTQLPRIRLDLVRRNGRSLRPVHSTNHFTVTLRRSLSSTPEFQRSRSCDS